MLEEFFHSFAKKYNDYTRHDTIKVLNNLLEDSTSISKYKDPNAPINMFLKNGEHTANFLAKHIHHDDVRELVVSILERPCAVGTLIYGNKATAVIVLDMLKYMKPEQQTRVLSAPFAIQKLAKDDLLNNLIDVMDIIYIIEPLTTEQQASILSANQALPTLIKFANCSIIIRMFKNMTRDQQENVCIANDGDTVSYLLSEATNKQDISDVVEIIKNMPQITHVKILSNHKVISQLLTKRPIKLIEIARNLDPNAKYQFNTGFNIKKKIILGLEYKFGAQQFSGNEMFMELLIPQHIS